MKVIETEIEGVLIIEPEVFGDERGWFMESYNQKKYEEAGIKGNFVQDNHSFSAKAGVLRGIHFQMNPEAQAKIVRCTRGKLLDVAVDLRKESATYKKWVMVELSAENKREFYIPRGFGHAFVTLVDDCEMQYKADGLYAPEADRSIRYNDPEIGIDWGEGGFTLSQKDQNAPLLKDSDCNF